MDKNFPVIKNYIQAIQSLSFLSSKKNNNGEICYPYSYGYSASQFHSTLLQLNLSKKQIKELENITNQLIIDTEIKEKAIK